MAKLWLFKTEPSEYSYDDLERDKKAVWDGVSNNQALKYLRQVKLGDEILIYHTGNERAIVGMAEAISEPYSDPKEKDDSLVIINLKPKRRFPRQLSLSDIKATEALKEFDLVRLPRLSVMPISKEYWQVLEELLGD